MTLKIFILCILYILVVRYLMYKQNNKEVDDIYNVKKKGKNAKHREDERGTAYNKNISDSSHSGSAASSSPAQPSGPLSRSGF